MADTWGPPDEHVLQKFNILWCVPLEDGTDYGKSHFWKEIIILEDYLN